MFITVLKFGKTTVIVDVGRSDQVCSDNSRLGSGPGPGPAGGQTREEDSMLQLVDRTSGSDCDKLI